MRIRIATTSPRNEVPGFTTWNVRSVDEFVERFVRDGMLVIGNPASLGITMPIRNFVAHNKYIATFDTACPLEDCIFILGALCEVDVPNAGAAFHNINVDAIPDDYDPLKNPNAEYLRRAGQ